MSKATKADIKYFKGRLLIELQKKLQEDGTIMSKDELEDYLKWMVDLDPYTSVKDITHEQMQDLKEAGKFLAAQTKIKLKEDENDEINLNF